MQALITSICEFLFFFSDGSAFNFVIYRMFCCARLVFIVCVIEYGVILDETSFRCSENKSLLVSCFLFTLGHWLVCCNIKNAKGIPRQRLCTFFTIWSGLVFLMNAMGRWLFMIPKLLSIISTIT